MQTKMDLTFLHPDQSNEKFKMGVAPQATPRQCVQQLIKGDHLGPWLEPAQTGRPYELVLSRTQKLLDGDTPLGTAGVLTGDTLAVMRPGQGAAA
jgi:hypothetical protein